jgi:PA14 domain
VVNDEGTDTLVVTIGREYHQINSGWVRLLAPYTKRGGVEAPGSSLPITVPAGNNLTFLFFHRQDAYIPYIKSVYPGGQLIPRTHPSEGLMFTTYRLSKEQVAGLEGATAQPLAGNGNPVRVDTLGAPPAGLSLTYPAPMRWRAGLRAPRYWNYVFKIGPGPAKLTIDGVKVLEVAAGQPEQLATVSLVRGLHAVDFEGTLTAAGKPALFQWAPEPEQGPGDSSRPPTPSTLNTPRPEELTSNLTTTAGLLGIVQFVPAGGNSQPMLEQRRLDSTLANCCLSESAGSGGREYTIDWTGTLHAPVTGVYSMTLLAQGLTDLKIDGKSVIHIEEESDQATGGSVELTAGPHPVEVSYKRKDGPSAIEWAWTPPNGETSIVPPSALAPPPNSTVGDRMPQDTLGHGSSQPTDVPPDTVP